MDMSEFQSEMCGMEAKKQTQNRKEEMDRLRMNVREEHSVPENRVVLVSLLR